MNANRLVKTIALLSVVLAPGATHAAVNIQNNGPLPYKRVYYSGWSRFKYDLVFVGDGFTDTEQTLFNDKVDESIEWLRNFVPFNNSMCALNVWRVNVVSNESGIDVPAEGVTRDTELNCRFGDGTRVGEETRVIKSDSRDLVLEAAAYAPDADMIVVLVNEPNRTGGTSSGGMVFSTIEGYDGAYVYFVKTVTHELGHGIGGLGDEYTCRACDGSDADRAYPANRGEPLAPNLTINLNLANTTDKWADLIPPNTPVPTTVDNIPDPNQRLGLWEGGDYYALEIYRPQRSCHMQHPNAQFCAVCRGVLEQTLEPYCGPCESPYPFLIFPVFLCRFGDLILAEFTVRYDANVTFRQEIRGNFTDDGQMERLGDDDAMYLLEGAPDDFEMRIVDNRGRVVASGERYDGGILAAGYTIDRSRQYFVDITGEKPTGELVRLRSRLYINGQEQILPGQPR